MQREEEVDGVAGDVGAASVPRSCFCSFLTIFGLLLRIPWLALPPSPSLLHSPPPARPATAFCVSRISHPSVLCVFLLFPLPSVPFSSCFFPPFFYASFVYPTFSCVRFSFSLQFHLLATRDAKWPFRQCPLSRSPSSLPSLSLSLSQPAYACCNASVGRLQLHLQGRILMSLLSRIRSDAHVPPALTLSFPLPQFHLLPHSDHDALCGNWAERRP